MNSYISLRSEYIIETKFLIVVIYLELQRQQQQHMLQVRLIEFLKTLIVVFRKRHDESNCQLTLSKCCNARRL